MSWKTVQRALNLTTFSLLVSALCLFFIWPEHVADMGLTPDEGRVIILQLISFLLLLGGFQTSLRAAWRRLSLAAAFVVLGEATLIAFLV